MPAQVDLAVHPLDPDAGVRAADPQRRGDVRPADLAGELQPPQRQQLPVGGIEPPGRLGNLPPLAGQAEPQDGQLGEVRPRIGQLAGFAEVAGAFAAEPPGTHLLADLVDGDRDQPGPEPGRRAQRPQIAEDPQDGLLHHVVHVGVAIQGAADEVVEQRQVPGDEFLGGPPVPVLGGDDELLGLTVQGSHRSAFPPQPAAEPATAATRIAAAPPLVRRRCAWRPGAWLRE
jgi:hypothetical protein